MQLFCGDFVGVCGLGFLVGFLLWVVCRKLVCLRLCFVVVRLVVFGFWVDLAFLGWCLVFRFTVGFRVLGLAV